MIFWYKSFEIFYLNFEILILKFILNSTFKLSLHTSPHFWYKRCFLCQSYIRVHHKFVLRSTRTKCPVTIARWTFSPATFACTDPLQSPREWKSNFCCCPRGVQRTGLVGSCPVNPLQLPFRIWNLKLVFEWFLEVWTIQNTPQLCCLNVTI